MRVHDRPSDSPESAVGPTPICLAPVLGRALGVDLRIKRDDLLPMLGGGNKVRKGLMIMQHAADVGHDAVVTTGGVQSNHARAMALLAARWGWKCRLVLHGDEARARSPRGNLLLMHLANAEIAVAPTDEVAERLDAAMEDFRLQGLNPCLVPGGGHTTQGALAYVEAAAELAEQCRCLKWMPTTIVLASGTGTTQAGIVAGLRETALQCEVIGVSIARKNPRGAGIVQSAYEDVCRHMGIAPEPERITFLDDWVGEGYEQADAEVLKIIARAASLEGLLLDPTYSGKAFRALTAMIGSGRIPAGARVVFWHTGGIFNLMASDYWSRSPIQ